MDEYSEFGSDRAKIMARLATLQRLKEEMSRNNRSAALGTIEQMMQAESALLRKLQQRDLHSADDASNDSDGEERRA